MYKEGKELFGALVPQHELPHDQITLAELKCESELRLCTKFVYQELFSDTTQPSEGTLLYIPF